MKESCLGGSGPPLGRQLKKRGVSFVQIVPKKADAGTADHQIIEGDGISDEAFKLAGIQNARMVIAAREDDSENAFVVLACKEMNPKVPVPAVASSAISLRRLKLAHADIVFSPAAVGSRILADLVQGNTILPEFHNLLEGHIKNLNPAADRGPAPNRVNRKGERNFLFLKPYERTLKGRKVIPEKY